MQFWEMQVKNPSFGKNRRILPPGQPGKTTDRARNGTARTLGILVCYPLMYSCNFPFPRMGHQLVGGKGKSCKIENLCYGKEDWIRPPAEENRGSIISWNTTIIKDRFVEGEMLPLPCFAARPHSYPGTRSRISKKGHGKPHC